MRFYILLLINQRYMVVANFETFWIDLTSDVLRAQIPLLNPVPAEQVNLITFNKNSISKYKKDCLRYGNY